MYSADVPLRQTAAVNPFSNTLFFDRIRKLTADPMLRFRKPCLIVLWLVCAVSVRPQTSANPAGPISAALEAGDFAKAIELSRAALEEAPNNPQLWTLQGIAFASQGDGKDALTSFQQALKIAPDNLAALAGAAQIQYQAGNQAAVPFLNHLLKLRPGDPTANAMLAVLNY